MNIEELCQVIANFSGLSHAEKIKIFAWHLHVNRQKDRFNAVNIRECYNQLHLAKPVNISSCFQQLQEKKPPDILKDSRGYRLEQRVREALNAKYGTRPATIAIESTLAGLPGKVSSESARLFLSEALSCFRAKAFRATIIMTWNLAFDHFEDWILANHLTSFNAQIVRNYPRKTGVTISKKEDFSTHFKESEVIEIAKSAGLIHDSIKKILQEKLNRRNLFAHPSLIDCTQYQAEDTIFDLVNNIILRLT